MTTKTPPVNDEFGLDDLDVQAKPSAPKKNKKVLDPEMDKKNWPMIHIEMEEGKPNYEYLAAHGTMKDGRPFGHELQVMRGVDVQVPPSIVYMLQDAVSAHYVQRRDPTTGKMLMTRQDRSSIPWRMIKGGKYF